jgi:signal transduction histidine kinase/transcriptional regulator with XRE-family HTH domain
VLSAAADYDAMLAAFAQLVVDSGFADQCLVEACVSASCEDDDTPRPATSTAPGEVRSLMRVPLVARGALVGAMSLTRFKTSRGFSEADRGLAEALGWCAALIVDNAGLVAVAQVARASAERAHRAKDEFLSLASHELRTPLTAVLGWARMLLTGGLDAERQHQAVEAIERNARAEVRLVEDLLDVGILLGGDQPLRRSAMHPIDVIARAFEAVRFAARARDVRLRLVITLDPGKVVGDAERLQRIVTCLLDNAIKVTPRAGEVIVRIGRVGDDVEISVEDGGVGVDPSLVRALFDDHRPQDPTTNRSFGVLSLGLVLAKRLVELHGGTIRLTSEGRGHGAKFVARIPAPREGHRSDPPPASTREESRKVTGEALRRVRQEHGWTQEELAAAAGLTADDIERFESGALSISLAVARRICAALHVSIDALTPRDPDLDAATRSGLHWRLRPKDDGDADADAVRGSSRQ